MTYWPNCEGIPQKQGIQIVICPVFAKNCVEFALNYPKSFELFIIFITKIYTTYDNTNCMLLKSTTYDMQQRTEYSQNGTHRKCHIIRMVNFVINNAVRQKWRKNSQLLKMDPKFLE